jgi:hypothetical protein
VDASEERAEVILWNDANKQVTFESGLLMVRTDNRKLSPRTIERQTAALRFLFVKAQLLYDLLFRASAAVLIEVACEPVGSPFCYWCASAALSRHPLPLEAAEMSLLRAAKARFATAISWTATPVRSTSVMSFGFL